MRLKEAINVLLYPENGSRSHARSASTTFQINASIISGPTTLMTSLVTVKEIHGCLRFSQQLQKHLLHVDIIDRNACPAQCNLFLCLPSRLV